MRPWPYSICSTLDTTNGDTEMKTGNSSTPNPKKVLGGSFKKDSSNVVSESAKVQFSAKKDSFNKKK